jgi:hypothetical protein
MRRPGTSRGDVQVDVAGMSSKDTVQVRVEER